MFKIRWLRRLVRRNTRPIPVDRAAEWKKRFAVAYMLIGWNVFGLVCYMFYTGKRDWADYYGLKTEAEKALSPAQQWARSLKIDNAKVLRIQGVQKIELEDISLDTTTTASESK